MDVCVHVRVRVCVCVCVCSLIKFIIDLHITLKDFNVYKQCQQTLLLPTRRDLCLYTADVCIKALYVLMIEFARV